MSWPHEASRWPWLRKGAGVGGARGQAVSRRSAGRRRQGFSASAARAPGTYTVPVPGLAGGDVRCARARGRCVGEVSRLMRRREPNNTNWRSAHERPSETKTLCARARRSALTRPVPAPPVEPPVVRRQDRWIHQAAS